MKNMNKYENCLLCPRKCGINRRTGQTGVCGVSSEIKVARAALHYWEEPCISGKRGSGAVFFSGCSLHCVFCQNREISDGKEGKVISKERLSDIFIELADKGANNINLVTPGQYIPDIVWAVNDAKSRGMKPPIIYNTSGYENVTELKLLEGIVDVYLPDFKYMDSTLSARYSRAKDYPSVAKQALSEMVRQQPEVVIDDATGLIQKGVIVRQLLLPGHVNDAKAVLKYLYDTYHDHVYISMMSQFTPIALEDYPEINRTVTKREYERLVNYALEIGITNAFIQEGDVAKDSFIPAFDCEGV
ncbi:4Fe-4S cluster-binding domain-containing protein [Agathobacter rectalis]|uniref:4Fe-4S cluster-binding domain-containing protein n=1 Tax=Agathobacter rectalis TaxID=39491 RepID=A0AAW4WV60_9FIRM|nr:4Fe-4S cluster-binding domain-containing protein [Agathobacter rectalis]MCC2748535.1 4Fe-4S cluster-binding domain-containing protein [Agathobacter rectalis]NSI36881.1 4Fe-4S cluster-binding domain-containing protein [Agathobacter rectalis]NSI40155.1 4Fe-4S cluster-binding domain-containing protein [Agathobacter rectalis]NSI69586.1 4Fe-4S cluster-binding domain-containing protein [Agathobacter rectalis]NSI75533.1 4Fe-4S cluster-binding domain-containing protein [Agathobacter rectalis]